MLLVAKFDGAMGEAYSRGMTTFISAEGLIEIPEVFRKADALQPGQRCEIERLGSGEYRVHVAADDDKPKQSLVDWLLACPEKDWFVPME